MENFDKIFETVTNIAMKTLNISREQAQSRIIAIKKSGILDKLGEPTGILFQLVIDFAMQIPQLEYEEINKANKFTIPDVSNSVCLSGKRYSDCHIHDDSIVGCLDCGNFQKQKDC